MELGLGLFGAVLLLCGVAAGIAVIHTGHIYGLFKAAGENPIFTIAVIVGFVSVLIGLLTGTHSAEGAFKLFEDGVGWALTIFGSFMIIGFIVALTVMYVKNVREKAANRRGATGPGASGPDNRK
jgi:hypothetical protein